MITAKRIHALCLSAAVSAMLFFLPALTHAQNQVMGELQFNGATKVERGSGVWVDGQYVGYLKELKGDKKIMLLPGDHQIAIRQVGYSEFTQDLVVEPGTLRVINVRMTRDLRATNPGHDAAELKLEIKPERAAVFVDDGYAGHASDFGGSFHAMLLSPGKHHIKVELPGYQTFETEVELLPMQKSKVSTELVAGSIQQAGALIRP
jgi:hypothetical protein